jgi:hypothetical protein
MDTSNVDDMTAVECLERAKQVHDNARINESPLYWIERAQKKIDR